MIEFYYTEPFMSELYTVVIGATEHLASLRERAGASGEVLTFSDTDSLAALAAITAKRPQVIALERLFAATSRGAALINRIKADPLLASSEIRVVSHDGAYSRISRRRTPPAIVPTESPQEARAAQLDYRGTRRAPRFRMNDGTEAQMDGALVKVVDLSTCGAQLISHIALKPQQRIRMTLADDLGLVKFNAVVAWVSYEIPKGVARYRAGIDFKDAEPKSVEAFCNRHKQGT